MTVSTDSCIICSQVMSVENPGVPVTGIDHPYSHWFHGDCVSKWFNFQQRGDRLPSCPICRQGVTHINAVPIPHVPADPYQLLHHPIVYAAIDENDDVIRGLLETGEDISEEDLRLVFYLGSNNIRVLLIESGRVSDRDRGLEVIEDASGP